MFLFILLEPPPCDQAQASLLEDEGQMQESSFFTKAILETNATNMQES